MKKPRYPYIKIILSILCISAWTILILGAIILAMLFVAMIIGIPDEHAVHIVPACITLYVIFLITGLIKIDIPDWIEELEH